MKENIIKIARRFLGEVNTEAKKVVWPGRKELIASTTIVIVTVLLVAAIIGLMDFIFSKLIGVIVR